MILQQFFQNLLDNAIEACKDIKNSTIEFRCNDFNHIQLISIKNPTNENLQPKHNPIGRHQGLGLDNVRRTLKKYHGTLDTEVSDGVFTATLLLPKNIKEGRLLYHEKINLFYIRHGSLWHLPIYIENTAFKTCRNDNALHFPFCRLSKPSFMAYRLFGRAF